jgi:mannan endo-1,4-beta-mannosidase
MAMAALPAGGRPFIRVVGTRFMEGKRPFYFVGTNLNVMHGPTARGSAPVTIAAAAGDGLQVGRLWALGEDLERAPHWKRKRFLFRAGPDRWQPEAYEQLDRVIAEAGKRGLRLIITLSNRWKDYGGIPMYLRWAGHVDVESYGYSDRFFTDPKCKAWFAEHVRRIVGRTNSITKVPYKDDPTIMAWELQNEMTGTPEAAPARRKWVIEMARMIRGIDPSHLIVPGTVGYNLQVERDNWIKMCSLEEVDFCDQHIYPEEHLRSKGIANLRRYIDDRVQLAHHVVGKPIIFGEFGFADRGPARARARKHRAFLERLFFDGGNGAMIWIYQPTLSWKRKFGVLIDKPRYRSLRSALGRVARRVARQEVKNRNPRLGPAQGRRPIAPTHVMLVRHRPPHRAWSRGGRSPRTLRLSVDRFYRAWFEEAGSWDGGTLVHAYGRRTGWFEFRFTGPGFAPDRLTIAARLSSEYPSKAAPPHGFSQVELSLDGQLLQTLRVKPDDGLGAWYTVETTDPKLLRRLRRGAHVLRLEVKEGIEANGVAIYGREAPLNREPVEEPGPIRITAFRGGP